MSCQTAFYVYKSCALIAKLADMNFQWKGVLWSKRRKLVLFDVSWLKIGEKIMDSILYDTD
jgi:hypothetical protein